MHRENELVRFSLGITHILTDRHANICTQPTHTRHGARSSSRDASHCESFVFGNTFPVQPERSSRVVRRWPPQLRAFNQIPARVRVTCAVCTWDFAPTHYVNIIQKTHCTAHTLQKHSRKLYIRIHIVYSENNMCLLVICVLYSIHFIFHSTITLSMHFNPSVETHHKRTQETFRFLSHTRFW